MKKLIKITLILGGILIGAYTIAALLAVLSKREEDDDDVVYCDHDYDDLEPYDWESEWPEDFDVDESDEDIS